MLIYIKEIQDTIQEVIRTHIKPIADDYLSRANGGTIAKNLVVNGTISSVGALSTDSSLTVKGTSTFSGAVTLTQGFTSNSSVTVNGQVIGKNGFEIYHATPFIDFHFANSSADYTSRIIEYVQGGLQMVSSVNITGNLSGSGGNNITGFSKIYNAVWNDYAEFFERGEDTEPGDIISMDLSSDDEVYVKADRSNTFNSIVGVHSDTYGHLIGGDQCPESVDFVEHNIKKFIPVGLSGRVDVKVIGHVNKGDIIVLSETPGIGRAWKCSDDDMFRVGVACHGKKNESLERVKVFIKY